MQISFYDQIPNFIDSEESFIGFSKPSILSDKILTEYETQRSEKKQQAIRDMNQRIIQYTYKV